MILLVKIILAHLIGDFLLQPKSWVREKEQLKLKSLTFYGHLLIHGALILLLLWNPNYWAFALLLMLVHGVIDTLKLYCQQENNRAAWFIGDQTAHVVSMLLLWYFWFQPTIDFSTFIGNDNIWIFITALLMLTSVSGIAIKILLDKWTREINDGDNESLNNAGKYIGILERLFVFTFIITGNWSAIGFLLAAKSVFRFGDLRESKDRKLTEYILIGTLLSFGLALLAGVVVLRIT